MTDKAIEIAALLAPTVQSLGLELLGVEYLPAPGGALLRLYIDLPMGADGVGVDEGSATDGRTPDGSSAEIRAVGIEDCEAVSREVSAQLDVADPISAHYTLEVSSPGVDRLLFTAAQFIPFTGQIAKVTLKLPQDGRRRLQGKIIAVHIGESDAGKSGGDSVVFDVDGSEFAVVFENIDKARLVPDWAALGFAPVKKDASEGDQRPGKKKAAGRNARSGKQAMPSKSMKPTKKPAADKPSRAE